MHSLFLVYMKPGMTNIIISGITDQPSIKDPFTIKDFVIIIIMMEGHRFFSCVMVGYSPYKI